MLLRVLKTLLIVLYGRWLFFEEIINRIVTFVKLATINIE